MLSSFIKVFLYANLLALASANLFRGGVDNTRIIGGKELTEDSAPYSVSLMSSGSHFCGGSLITNRVILTAAHCLGGSISVLIGRHDFDDKDGELISASKQIPHPKYDEETSEYDMALIVLSRPVSVAVQAVTVNDDNSYPSVGTTARVMGWGNLKTNGFDLPDVPYMADVDVISNQQCEDLERGGASYSGYGFGIYQSNICTFTQQKDACQGDSGGPLIVRGNNASQDKLIGVVSWGIGCAYLPGVYGRVSKSYGWIQDRACLASSDTSGSTLCGTDFPTISPTTAEPTASPSENPTSVPSSEPSAEPTASPSETPSLSPSSEPSAAPSLSVQPSEMPSSSPSLRPSGKPSASPSTLPSSSPTTSSQPSSEPTSMPSDVPSTSPSSNPSNSPSISAAPTQSLAPTKPKLINTGVSLIISATELVDDEGNAIRNASSTFGSYAYVGSLMSFLISAWLLV
mmetsp:Transcript_4012/g.6099  ORF Transcript_4012/g.6099 Transcript_4012/m.6099 type:complete len:459 (+) Transcript_4012:71-1447(+)